MKILWHSNAPFLGSGYGNQTDLFSRAIVADGHQINVSAFAGLQGSPLVVNDGLRILPSGFQSYGVDILGSHVSRLEPDVAVGLIDVWVFEPDMMREFPYCWWTPIDSDPIPPPVSRVLRHVRHPWAMSRFGERKMREAGIEAHYVPHGIDTEVYKPLENRNAARAILGVPDDAFLFVSVAANKGYPSRKNLPQLIKAFASIAKRHDDAFLYIHTNTISTPESIDVEGIVRFYDIPADRVIFPNAYDLIQGLVKPATMNGIYNAADAFILPSAGEGFGIPALEAQAAGVPVIVSDFSAQTELCGSGILINVDPDDLICTLQGAEQALNLRPSKIAGAMEAAYTGWKDNKLMREGARKFALDYDYKLVYEKYMKPALEDAYRENKKMMGTSEGKYFMKGYDYHWREPEDGHYKLWVEKQLSFLPEKGAGKSVLDFGCGDGWIAAQLVKRGYKVTGVEPVAGALAEAKKRVPEGIFFDKAPSEGDYDYVLALDVIEHMEDPSELIAQVKKAKEFSLISTPPPGLDAHAVRGYTVLDLWKLFGDYEFETLWKSNLDQLIKLSPKKEAKEAPEKLKIAVLSDCRVPTRGDGGHGLGNSSYEIAKGLTKAHEVTFFAGQGSSFDGGELIVHESEEVRVNWFMQKGLDYDVIIDCSHQHLLSLYRPEWPIINRLGDGECQYSPPRSVMPSEYLRGKYGNGRIIKTGIDLDKIPERNGHDPEEWVLFFGRLVDQKGVKSAIESMRLAGVKLKFMGPMQGLYDIPAEDYFGEKTGAEKWDVLQKAYAVIAPGGDDHAPRVPLEAAAAGVPTICLSYDGTKEHVGNGVSGYHADDMVAMGKALSYIPKLDAKTIRGWVKENHSYETMISEYEKACRDAIRGEKW